MRIDEASASNGESSVRPGRYADPHALSQAWYDALYPNRALASRGARTACAGRTVAGAGSTQSPAPTHGQLQRTAGAAGGALAPDGRAASRPSTGVGAGFSTAQRVALRRAASLRIIEPHQRDASALHVELDQADGPPLRLLFQTSASGVRVVAVCARSQRSRIESALHRMRAALAARGLSFDYEVRVT